MSTTKPPVRPDRLGAFLTQYKEYLDGKRSYQDLPPSISKAIETTGETAHVGGSSKARK